MTEGDEISIITYGQGVLWAKELCREMAVEADIVDLRTLLPWDKETVEASVKKTGKVLLINEDTITGSISGEIAAWIGETCFASLDAPVMREGSLDTAVPFSKNLEENFLPRERMKKKIKALIEY